MVTKAKTAAKAAPKTLAKTKARKPVAKKPILAKKPMIAKKPGPKARVVGKSPATAKPTATPTATPTTAPETAPSSAAKAASGIQGVTRAATPALRKKELIDVVVARSGIKKKDAKPVIETMLDVLGETLISGKDMNLQPFGRVMVKKQMDKPNATVIVARIRQAKAKKPIVVKSTLGQAAE